MRRMLLVGASALLTSCLLFTSLDDATGGGEPPSSEAGADSPSAIADASDSATPTGDASIDSAPGTDAGFCKADAGGGQVFCTEFDGPTVAEGWSGFAAGVGTLELDQGNMLAKIPVIAQYDQGRFVYRTIDGAFSTLTCSFAFRRDVLGEEDLSIAELLVETGGDDYLVALYTLPTNGRLLVQRYPDDGGDGVITETPIDLAPPIAEWHRVTVQIATAQIRAYVDGQLTGALENKVSTTQIRTTFRLGVPQVDGANDAPWELRFDDVRCNLNP